MKKITVSFFFVTLFTLCGCVDDRPSIINSAWVCLDEQVGELSLYFSEQTCQATISRKTDGEWESIQDAKGYTYIPPKITFFLADGTQVVGIFYDNYTRLEVVTPNREYSFIRTQ